MAATKSTPTLPRSVFYVEVKNHELLKLAYDSYLAEKRLSSANTKTRGMVRGGGKKPWRQKGTGRARFGSSRNPIWRGGGVVFGPLGIENYTKKMTTRSKRTALRQALTLAHKANKLHVSDKFTKSDGKTKTTIKALDSLEATSNVLIVTKEKDVNVQRATRNIPSVKVSTALYVTVYDILNADTVVISQDCVSIMENWLKEDKK